MTHQNSMNEKEKNDLHQNYPLLESMQRRNAFKVPNHFFEELPQTIQSRIQEHKKPSYLHAFNPVLRPKMAVVYLMLILLTGIYLFQNNSSNQNMVTLALNVDSIDNDQLADMLDSYVIESETTYDNDNEDQETINYLIENYNDINNDINDI